MSGHHYRLPMKRNENGEIRGPMDKTNGHSGGIRLSDLNEQMIRVFEAEPTITRCAFCDWKHMGTAIEGRRAAAEHRTSAHPEIVITPRRRGKKTPPRKVR